MKREWRSANSAIKYPAKKTKRISSRAEKNIMSSFEWSDNSCLKYN